MPGIPDRGNEKPALSRARQKEKATGGERERERGEFVRHSVWDIYRTTRFLASIGIDLSFTERCRQSKLERIFAKVKGARFANPRKEYFSLCTYPSKDRRVASVIAQMLSVRFSALVEQNETLLLVSKLHGRWCGYFLGS